MSKHTPGPWESVGNLVRSPMHQPQGLPSGVQIADCRDGYFLSHTDEAKANASLIAAAPELYALAERIARLNKDAGEIGAGMLASLVDEANRIIENVES